ncbi:transcriptional regulator [Escherichia coli]|nr:transcriptional regulator [Escherichia coli]
MANLYDLKKFDLNLLVIFECIYQHLSISKAAESLYITPSAVSQSLQRLRAQFNDLYSFAQEKVSRRRQQG